MTTTNPPAEFLPCPMCGGHAQFVKHSAGIQGTQGFDKWDAVACKACGTTVGACDRRFRCRHDAIAAWNRRAAIKESPATQEAIRNAALEEAADLFADFPRFKRDIQDRILALKSHPPAPVDGDVPEGAQFGMSTSIDEMIEAIKSKRSGRLPRHIEHVIRIAYDPEYAAQAAAAKAELAALKAWSDAMSAAPTPGGE